MYLEIPDFTEAVFENWESKFLQMGAPVVFIEWFQNLRNIASELMKNNSRAEPRGKLNNTLKPHKFI